MLGGVLVAPVGGSWQQDLRLYRKTKSGFEEKSYGGCVFVPMRS
jgi:protein-L-isoaspartate O-methyltransferase